MENGVLAFQEDGLLKKQKTMTILLEHCGPNPHWILSRVDFNLLWGKCSYVGGVKAESCEWKNIEYAANLNWHFK